MASEEDKDPEKEHRTLVRQLLNERTTESGRACIEAAAYCLDIGELAEARQWIKLALDAGGFQESCRMKRTQAAVAAAPSSWIAEGQCEGFRRTMGCRSQRRVWRVQRSGWRSFAAA